MSPPPSTISNHGCRCCWNVVRTFTLPVLLSAEFGCLAGCFAVVGCRRSIVLRSMFSLCRKPSDRQRSPLAGIDSVYCTTHHLGKHLAPPSCRLQLRSEPRLHQTLTACMVTIGPTRSYLAFSTVLRCCGSRLGLPDRASALGLTKAFLDFDGSEEAWRRYDKITAREVREREVGLDRPE